MSRQLYKKGTSWGPLLLASTPSVDSVHLKIAARTPTRRTPTITPPKKKPHLTSRWLEEREIISPPRVPVMATTNPNIFLSPYLNFWIFHQPRIGRENTLSKSTFQLITMQNKSQIFDRGIIFVLML